VSPLNVVLLGSAVIPVGVLVFVIWYFFRAARRNDEREAAERAGGNTST
jgi:heme/copper-type cytochrome/quinol oxidase subunit 2